MLLIWWTMTPSKRRPKYFHVKNVDTDVIIVWQIRQALVIWFKEMEWSIYPSLLIETCTVRVTLHILRLIFHWTLRRWKNAVTKTKDRAIFVHREINSLYVAVVATPPCYTCRRVFRVLSRLTKCLVGVIQGKELEEGCLIKMILERRLRSVSLMLISITRISANRGAVLTQSRSGVKFWWKNQDQEVVTEL